jgi:hypothetical protein
MFGANERTPTVSTTAAAAPEYLTEKQTAAKVGVSPESLRSDRHRGVGLPYSRIAQRIRYRVADIEEYIKSNTVVPEPKPLADRRISRRRAVTVIQQSGQNRHAS